MTATETFRTRGDASRWLAKAEAEQGRGWIDPREGEVLLADYAKRWIDGRANLSRRTREIYDHPAAQPCASSGHRGRPTARRAAPRSFHPWARAGLVRRLAQTHGRSVAAKAYVRFRQVLGQAVDDEHIARNPCRIDGGGIEHHPSSGR